MNDRAQLARAEMALRSRINEDWMMKGVTMWDPSNTYVDADVILEPDVSILPGTVLKGRCLIERGAQIGPFAYLTDCYVGENAVVASVEAFGAHVGEGARVSSFVVLAPGTRSLPATKSHPFTSSKVSTRSTLYAGAVESLAKRRLVLVTGTCHPELAKDIAKQLGIELTEANVREFANGEIHCRFDESIRGAHVFIVQTHSSPVNSAVMEQLIMIDAAKRASAKSITAVIPNYGYARQDRKSAGREPITAKLIADMLQTAGANRVLSVDFHSGQIQGFFDIPVDHLVAAPVLEEYLKANADPRDLVVVAPDAGRVKVAERYAQHLGCELALVHKTRPRGTTNIAEARHIVGDVNGRHCVLIDDMIDTAGTIVAGCDLLKAHGAEEIWAMATHAVFSPPAVDRLFNAPVSRVIVTDTLPLGPKALRKARDPFGGDPRRQRHFGDF